MKTKGTAQPVKPEKLYLLNLRSGRIHLLPPKEQCNIDQVPRKYKRRFETVGEAFYGTEVKYPEECRHCFP